MTRYKNEELNRVIGTNIKTLRINLGQSQAEFARKIGISPQQLQKYESGKDSIGAARLWALAKLTNHSITYFYDVIADVLPMSQKDITKTLRLIRAWNGINNNQRRAFLDLVEVIPVPAIN